MAFPGFNLGSTVAECQGQDSAPRQLVRVADRGHSASAGITSHPRDRADRPAAPAATTRSRRSVPFRHCSSHGPYVGNGRRQSTSLGNNPDHEELIGGFLFAEQSHPFELPHPNSRRWRAQRTPSADVPFRVTCEAGWPVSLWSLSLRTSRSRDRPREPCLRAVLLFSAPSLVWARDPRRADHTGVNEVAVRLQMVLPWRSVRPVV
jgi:hypothetical protein